MNPLPHSRQRRLLPAATVSSAVLLVLLLAALGLAGLPSQASVSAAPVFQSCRAWAVIPMPNIPEKINVLSAVSASSHEDIWVVGYTKDYGNADNTARTLAIHWDGREWKIVPTPNPYNGNKPGSTECVTAWRGLTPLTLDPNWTSKDRKSVV